MRGSRRIRKAVGTLRRWAKPGGVVLMYHRVTDLVPDTYDLAVSPAHFAEHMEVVRRTCVPMHLIEMMKALAAGRLPRRAVAVTFDDGYYDNFQEAYPILRAAGVPATVFVVSGHVDSRREFWWDELERALLVPAQVPPRLQFSLNGRDYAWPTGTPDERAVAHRRLHSLISQQTTEQRMQLLDKLVAWSRVLPEGRPTYRAMRSDEMAELVSGGLVDIGGHTVNHPALSRLHPTEQRVEIEEGCRRLEEILGRRIEVFAYPYGRAVDWNSASAQIVREAGLQGAVTTIPGYVEAGADPYRLQRWAVGDWGRDQFARELESFFILRETGQAED
jgi:peptidoglycan/xylan/chitin deacetylase (PgdA/CDA1 family)